MNKLEEKHCDNCSKSLKAGDEYYSITLYFCTLKCFKEKMIERVVYSDILRKVIEQLHKDVEIYKKTI